MRQFNRQPLMWVVLFAPAIFSGCGSNSGTTSPTGKPAASTTVISAETKSLWKAFRKIGSLMKTGINRVGYENEYSNIKVEYDEWARGKDISPEIKSGTEEVMEELQILREVWIPPVGKLVYFSPQNTAYQKMVKLCPNLSKSALKEPNGDLALYPDEVLSAMMAHYSGSVEKLSALENSAK